MRGQAPSTGWSISIPRCVNAAYPELYPRYANYSRACVSEFASLHDPQRCPSRSLSRAAASLHSTCRQRYGIGANVVRMYKYVVYFYDNIAPSNLVWFHAKHANECVKATPRWRSSSSIDAFDVGIDVDPWNVCNATCCSSCVSLFVNKCSTFFRMFSVKMKKEREAHCLWQLHSSVHLTTVNSP